MSSAKEHKLRLERIKNFQSTQRLKPLATGAVLQKYSDEIVDLTFIAKNDVNTVYAARIKEFKLDVTRKEAISLIEAVSSGSAIDNILEPVFLSLFDGTMRAFKIGTKHGITASQLYNECKSFTYESASKSIALDSYTESLNERENIKRFGEQSSYSNGDMTRGKQTINMRDGSKMNKVKEIHFNGNPRATDGYDGSTVYQSKKHAKSAGESTQTGEVEHIISCAEVCNQLKSNKALNVTDIKDILNDENNLLVTSMQNNRGAKTGKFDKSSKELEQEINQGYVIDKQGRRKNLSEKDIETRKKMVSKMAEAQKKLDSATNSKVIKNITSDKEVQNILVKDAKDAAAEQSIGDVIVFIMKPLFYELRDCFLNGIEKGVKSNSFKSALKIRLDRMKTYILQQVEVLLKDGLLNFFRNFLAMLLEGILNCFVGIFKQVARMVKEGFKILLQIAPILVDKNKSFAEKGDAVLKLVASSLTIFASIGIESWLNSLGLGEPWSIIMSSVITAVLTALIMYLLDKLDLFSVNRTRQLQRLDEILNLKIEGSQEDMFKMINAYT